MSAYGQDPYQVYTQTQTETRTVEVDVPISELGEYMQRKIDELERERNYYRSTAHGFKGTAMLLQKALQRLNPKAPELSQEFLNKAYYGGIEEKVADNMQATLITTAPSLTEMGLDAKGKPVNPGEVPAAGGLMGGLKKLFG